MSPDSDCLEQLDGEVASPPASPASWVGSLSAPTQLVSVGCPSSPLATGNDVHLEPLALQFSLAPSAPDMLLAIATAARTAVTPSVATGLPSAPTVLQSSGLPSAPSPPPSCTAGSPSAPTAQRSSGSPATPSPPPPPPWSMLLPSQPYKIICRKCLWNAHMIHFRTCIDCRERW